MDTQLRRWEFDDLVHSKKREVRLSQITAARGSVFIIIGSLIITQSFPQSCLLVMVPLGVHLIYSVIRSKRELAKLLRE